MPDTWCIYHIKKYIHARPAPKDKFVVIVSRDSDYIGFLINSEIHPYIFKRPLLLACQVEIKASDYAFLDYDSYIACNELFFFKDAELIDKRCSVNIATKDSIQKVVAAAKTIEPYYQKLICSAI